MKTGLVVRASWLLCALVTVTGAVREAAALPPYSLVGTFELPAGTETFGVGPDGRVVAMRGAELLHQDGVNASSFGVLGRVDSSLVPSFGASFLQVSPDGGRLSFGDNGQNNLVHIVEFSALDPTPGIDAPTVSVPVPLSFDAVWSGPSSLFVTGVSSFGAPSFVVEVTGAHTGSPATRTVVENIGGAPGGVTIGGGHLFTGNGFDNGPGGSTTGDVRAFSLAEIASLALTPIDFEAGGVGIGRVLSANTLGFDSLGNLLVGGGDFFGGGDAGYAAVVLGSAIASALSGGGAVAPGDILGLAPGTEFDFYGIRANPVTGEVLVNFFGSDTVYRYAVPGPGSSAVLIGVALLARRRRRAL